MTHIITPHHRDLAAQLPAGAYHYLMHTLRKTLPDLLTDSPQKRCFNGQPFRDDSNRINRLSYPVASHPLPWYTGIVPILAPMAPME